MKEFAVEPFISPAKMQNVILIWLVSTKNKMIGTNNLLYYFLLEVVDFVVLISFDKLTLI